MEDLDIFYLLLLPKLRFMSVTIFQIFLLDILSISE